MTYLDSAASAPMMNGAMGGMDMGMMFDEPMMADTGMSVEEFQSLTAREIQDAVAFIESDVAPIWETSTLYYRGALFGDEQEGRSKIVSRDVHDTVNGILPSLMRVFFGSEKVVEFMPQGPEDVEFAEQMTDYVNYIVTRDNPGFSIFWDAFKDALVRKQGWIKYDWDFSLTPTSVTYTGLDQMSLMKLAQDLTVEANQDGVEVEFTDLMLEPKGIRVTVKKLAPCDRARLWALPNEEVIVDRKATSIELGCFTLLGHRTLKTKSALIALGYDESELDDIGSDDGGLRQLGVAQARLPVPGTNGLEANNNEAQEEYVYFEGFLYADKDGDGIAELHKVCAAGSNFKILHSEQVEDHNLAMFPCDPEPHTFFGDSIAEKTTDVQKVKSGVLRATSDSLAQSIFPRTVVSRTGVEIADVLNTEVGAIIRANNPGADVVALTTPFVGKDSYPFLAYMDEVRENRTGMSKVAQGLDPGALQNTTALAAANQFGKAQEHVEIIARHFAETGMKRLFRGLAKLVARHQRKSRMVSLRNKWIEVDPRGWKTDMDVTCNVALGAGTTQERLAVLMGVKQTQEQHIQIAGPNGPMVGLKELHNTYSQILSLSGFKNVETFFRTPQVDQSGHVPTPPPPPDPKILAIQADMAKADADRQADIYIKIAEINAKYKTTIDAAQIKAQSDALRVVADLQIQRSEAQNAKAKAAVS